MAAFAWPVSLEADTPSNLRDATHGADYLIITHADFAGALLPLVAHRRGQGLRVVVVDVQDVYDEFSAGRLDPEAIRSFIAYASAQWSKPAPSYVLLVGDGSYDFLGYSGYGSRNYIPPYLQMVNPIWGETAADNRYAMLDDDLLPDLMLGRLPVSSPAEAAIVVQKIVDYAALPSRQVIGTSDTCSWPMSPIPMRVTLRPGLIPCITSSWLACRAAGAGKGSTWTICREPWPERGPLRPGIRGRS